MKPIEQALIEVKHSVRQIVMFNSIIDSLVMLLILYLACMLLSISPWWSFIPAIIYAVIHIRGNLREINFAKIEETAPSLKEQLITVADNLDDKNEIVKALHQEVLQKMRDVKTSAFVDFGKLTRELAVMAAISFVIVGLAAFNVQLFDLQGTIKELREFKPFNEYDINQELLDFEESQNLSEILGDESITELGQQQLDLEINPVMNDVKIGSVNDVQRRTFKEVPPTEIRATTDASFQDEIPKEYQRIVKTYFKEITKS